MKLYGSIENRLEENKMFCESIEVGTYLTEFGYSDRHPYEVVEVINQKHIKVRKLDHKKKEGSEHFDNNWELVSNPNNPIKELKFRYNNWSWVTTYGERYLKEAPIQDPIIVKQIKQTGSCTVYRPTKVSFGFAEYYFDYTY